MSGAHYVAPYVTRMEKARIDSKSSLSQMLDILGKHDFNTKILAASLRSLEQIVQCAALSLPAITLKEELFDVLSSGTSPQACLLADVSKLLLEKCLNFLFKKFALAYINIWINERVR